MTLAREAVLPPPAVHESQQRTYSEVFYNKS